MTTLTFTDQDADYMYPSTTRPIGGATLTFSDLNNNLGQFLGFDFGGLYAYDDNTDDEVKLTVTITSGYSFDLTSLSSASVNGGQAFSVTWTYADYTTGAASYNMAADPAPLSPFSVGSANDVIKLEITADGHAVFNDFVVSDVRLIAPIVTGVSSAAANRSYKAGETIDISVSFDQAVAVTGTPQLTLAVGGAGRTINYSSGSGSNILHFSYTVQAGDNSPDLDVFGAGALALNGGVITGSSGGGVAVLTLPTPGAAGSLGASKSIVIDTQAPTVAISSNAASLKAGETATVTFSFSEVPTGLTAGDIVLSGGTLSGFAGSGQIYTATLTPAGNFDNGLAGITVTAGAYTDAAGNAGAGATLSVSYDTRPPGAPSSPALTSGSDSGVLGDNITKFDTPIFTGTSEAGATVRLYDTDGTTLLGLAVADGLGAWSITSVQLGEGQHTITAKATDAAGNVSSPGAGATFIIDTQAPPPPSRPALTSSSDSGAPGDGVTNVRTPTFTGTADANAVVKLYDTDETTVLGTAVADGSGAWSITSVQLSEGPHTITAKAADLAGNVSSAGLGVAVTISTSSPPEPQPEPGVVTVVTPGGNQVTGDAQDNLIAPSGGADTVSAGGGNDTVQGGASDDVLQGNVGDDSIAAGGGADLVYGGQSNDFLHGNTGDDRLYGDNGQDTVAGGQGADFVQGGQGDDFVFGDLGDDVVLGGRGDDQVFGGAGNDYLSGDLGADTLTGGAGADIFHSFGGAGLDLVTDFNQADGDRVLLDPGTSYVLSQVGGDVHVVMGGGGELILAGVQLSSLTSGWISA